MSELVVERVKGAGIEPYLNDLAALRIEVFREFPYLYEGTLEYETRYLRSYARSERSLVVIARDGAEVVGASTALPATEHDEEVAKALRDGGLDPARTYYFGESVLRTQYRGRGIGHAFFDAREARARELGFELAAFCAVERPADHPRRPADYVPHDAFWNKRGYVKHPEIRAELTWRDLDEAEQSKKPMLFWIKRLEGVVREMPA
jgi:GNAT superfamily N-acetyltransferase